MSKVRQHTVVMSAACPLEVYRTELFRAYVLRLWNYTSMVPSSCRIPVPLYSPEGLTQPNFLCLYKDVQNPESESPIVFHDLATLTHPPILR